MIPARTLLLNYLVSPAAPHSPSGYNRWTSSDDKVQYGTRRKEAAVKPGRLALRRFPRPRKMPGPYKAGRAFSRAVVRAV